MNLAFWSIYIYPSLTPEDLIISEVSASDRIVFGSDLDLDFSFSVSVDVWAHDILKLKAGRYMGISDQIVCRSEIVVGEGEN